MSCTAVPTLVTPIASPHQTATANKNDNPVFDSAFLQNQTQVPAHFVWPASDQPSAAGPTEELKEPVIDLSCLASGDEEAIEAAAKLVAKAGSAHGFMQVINHGVDSEVMERAFERYQAFFRLPAAQKMRAQMPLNGRWGYSAAHGQRFNSNLPWKETLSIGFRDDGSNSVVNYFTETLGEDFKEDGIVQQRYCEAMIGVCMKMMELLAISLGVERGHYKDFFRESHSVMRCNYYPSCPEPGLALGTGAHCDPTSITVLRQDRVPGLEVFYGGRWRSIPPLEGALVVNLGDTFNALTNGIYKSCLHRAVVNKENERKSMAFFLCPKKDKVIKPPQSLVLEAGSRKYPDFTWADMTKFTQKHYRADQDTLQSFFSWLHLDSSSKSSVA